ncbi:hypothetical protein AVEN_205676-1 [Araneus ventricosus]|uniref:Uncharacterized protein n=1 Tax=Araneus ventricosus TaxID=182803 RepID=A0A4Y2TC06_ARAVE|nr:hypothetical protein AVEN_205676-1 [Araneus ventricosus]
MRYGGNFPWPKCPEAREKCTKDALISGFQLSVRIAAQAVEGNCYFSKLCLISDCYYVCGAFRNNGGGCPKSQTELSLNPLRVLFAQKSLPLFHIYIQAAVCNYNGKTALTARE